MKVPRGAVLAAWLLAVVPVHCFGEDAEDTADATLTREQWRQRVEEARRRSEQFVAGAGARAREAVPPRSDHEETEAADRALNDPTLRQGDVVATTKGFVVFVGKDEEHQPTDFRPASNPP